MGAQTRTFFAAQLAHSASHSLSRSCFPLLSHRPVRCSNLISISKGGSNVSFAILRRITRVPVGAFGVMRSSAASPYKPGLERQGLIGTWLF